VEVEIQKPHSGREKREVLKRVLISILHVLNLIVGKDAENNHYG
jgi:hypothetical protein